MYWIGLILQNGDRVLKQLQEDPTVTVIGHSAHSKLLEGAPLLPYGGKESTDLLLELQKVRQLPTLSSPPVFFAIGRDKNLLKNSVQIVITFSDKTAATIVTEYQTFCGQIVDTHIIHSKVIPPQGVFLDEDRISVISEGLKRNSLLQGRHSAIARIVFKPC